MQFFFLMIRPPPTSTLFPYTTLSRSNLLFLWTDQQRADTLACYGNTRVQAPNLNALAAGATVFDRDRKSTRLNSSHPSISYAVFCLKKKKKLLEKMPPYQTGGSMIRI